MEALAGVFVFRQVLLHRLVEILCLRFGRQSLVFLTTPWAIAALGPRLPMFDGRFGGLQLRPMSKHSAAPAMTARGSNRINASLRVCFIHSLFHHDRGRLLE